MVVIPSWDWYQQRAFFNLCISIQGTCDFDSVDAMNVDAKVVPPPHINYNTCSQKYSSERCVYYLSYLISAHLFKLHFLYLKKIYIDDYECLQVLQFVPSLNQYRNCFCWRFHCRYNFNIRNTADIVTSSLCSSTERYQWVLLIK